MPYNPTFTHTIGFRLNITGIEDLFNLFKELDIYYDVVNCNDSDSDSDDCEEYKIIDECLDIICSNLYDYENDISLSYHYNKYPCSSMPLEIDIGCSLVSTNAVNMNNYNIDIIKEYADGILWNKLEDKDIRVYSIADDCYCCS